MEIIEKIYDGKNHRRFEINQDEIMLTKETDYHYAGFTINEGLTVYLPRIKRIGSSDEYGKRDHEFYVKINEGLHSRTYGHIKMEETNTKIIVKSKASLIADEVETTRDIEVYEHARVIMLEVKSISGTLIIRKHGYVLMPELERISGSLIVEEGAVFDAPRLQKVHNLKLKMRL